MRRKKRRRLAQIAVAAAFAGALVGVIGVAQATPENDDATAIAAGLRSFAERLNTSADSLGEYEALAESLPLVDLAPGSADALRLGSFLKDHLVEGANALDAGYTSLQDLEDDLEALDGSEDGVALTVGDVVVSGSSGGNIDVTIPITASRALEQPLDFTAGPATIDGGTLDVDLSLSTTLTFRLDASQTAPFPATAFSLVVPAGAPPAIDVCANVSTAVDAFSARLGFTDVTVSTDGTAKLDACARVTFSDPDSDGVLTRDEFASHALTEFAEAVLVDGDPAGNDLDAVFELDASLVPGSPDGSISFTDLNLAADPAIAVTSDFGNLTDFTNIDPGDVANGLSQFLAAFGGSQVAADGALPFVKDNVTRAFDVVSPLRDYVQKLTNALVVCGTTPGTATTFPTGSTANLTATTKVYCRARTDVAPITTETSWTSPVASEDTRTSGAAADTTAGQTPSEDAVFTMTSNATFAVLLEFDAGPPADVKTFGAIPRPETAQELFDEIAAAAGTGFDSSAGGVAYDPATKSLSFRIRGDFDPAPIGPGSDPPPTFDFGDQLRNATHLGGLQATASATTTIDAGQVDYDATFGVIMVPDEASITPAVGDPSLLDRFFVKVNPTAPEISVADVQVGGNVALRGQVGFLGVEVSGAAAENTFLATNGFPAGTAFGVMKAGTDPAVRVNITPTTGGIPVDGLPAIADAILVRDLVFNLNASTLAVCNLKATAGLGVSAKVEGGTKTLAQAGVAVNWPQVFEAGSCTPDPSTLQIAPSSSFDSDFFHFDPFPTVTGEVTAVAAAPNEGKVLIDGSKNPTPGAGNDATEFPEVGNLLNLTLRNKTTGATCKILTIAAQELTCASQLSGGSRSGDAANANTWKVGDEYVVEGNALGLLSIILDNLDQLVAQLEALGADVEATLPLVDVSTEELVAKITSLKRTIDDLRGFPKAEVQCARDAAFTQTDVSVLPDGTTIYCRATTLNTPTGVRWQLANGPGGLGAIADNAESGLDPDTADDPGALNTVGPTPTEAVQLTVHDGNQVGDNSALTTLDEWRLDLEWADAGGSNTAEFPLQSPPSSLQSLEELIEQKLGIADPNVFQLDLRDLPAPGAAAVADGTADSDSTGDTLSDGGELAGVLTGMLAIRTTDPGKGDRCTITAVSGDDSVTCNIADGWSQNDGYEIVGDGTKDLVIHLGAGFCGAAGGLVCKPTDRKTAALSTPLNLDLGAAGDLVSFDSASNVELGYAARATLEVGVPLALAVPVPVIVDTTGLDLEGRAALDPIDLSAGLGPVKVNVGAAIADKDPGTEGDQPGEGTAKVGATFTFKRGDDDGIPSNRTYSFLGTQSFFTSAGGLEADFQGVDQDCGGSTSGGTDDDACLVADVGVEPTPTFAGTLTVSCDIQPLPAAPTCSATPSGALTALSAAVNGDPLNWSMLIQILPHLLADLEHSLSGAAQDVKLPLAGETLDAGADVVDTFNNGVVIPFASLSAQITNAVDAAPTGDGDGVAEPEEVAKVLEKAIFDLIGPAGSVQLGGAPANLILDLNGDGQRTVADVVVIPRCGSPAPGPCEGAEGDSIEDIDDLRIVVWIGQGIDTQVPFDLGLDGVPLSLKGGLHASGSWSYLIDFGFAREGPYLVKSGKKTTLNDPATMKVNRPADVPADPDGNDDGVEDDPVPAQWIDQPYLEDDDAGFPAFAEVGMTLRRLPRTGSEEARCTITKVEADKLWCDDFSTSAVEGITWHFDPDDDASTDRYEVLALHAPDTGQDGGAPELLLTAELGLGDQPSACTNDPDALPGDVPGLETGYSTSRCIEAKVAFLTATARDRETGDADCGPNRANFASGLDPTTLCLTAFMDVTSTGTDPRITLANLGKADLTLGFTVDANVDVRFRTGIGTGPDFPSVVGAFHMYWGFTASTETAPAPTSLAVGFDQLHLDAGAFVGRFLAPTVKGIQHVTKPLQPVIETLQGEVPIVSDLSKLVGEGPVTMLDLLEAISDNDLSAVRSILQLIRFVNALPTDNSGLLIPLGNSPGAFDISPTRALGPQPTPDQAGSGITPTSAGTNLTDQLGSIGAGAASDECVGRGATFGVCGLTFPFLANASEIFGVLMGKDTTLVHYDAGTLKASAGFGYCFPPITIGPIPVQICLGGSFTVEGRFAMGYDTSGLRKVLDGGSGVALLDGIFIDDYDAAGKEVAEIKFTGTVYAEGAASLLIFKVGIRGEIIFLTTLDLDDRPNPDGKLRIEEIVNRLSNPICLFVVSGQIDAALSAFVEIDLFFFTKRFSIEIVRITLLKFEVKCEPEVPNLADVVDGSGNVITDPATAGTRLVLNVGNTGGGFQDRRDERNIQEDAIDETLVVRQMEDVTTGPNAGRTRFSISGFGIKEDEYLLTSAVHAGTAVVEAYGHDGDDNFSFLAGGGNEGTKTDAAEVDLKEFEPKVLVRAGIGNDEVTSGNGADDIEGGANDDRIISGTGADRIRGGDGNDSIDAGEGNDTDVQGGPNDDTINGGPGGDNLQGNGGDDNISAGPDEPSATSVDVLIGGAGNDNLAGDGGDDDLYGDEVITTCTADGVDTGNTEDGDPNDDNIDSLIGGTGNDYLHGGAGRDQLEGNDGADELCGGGFHDEIVGGNGKDTAEGGSGDDDITGGTDDSPAANGGDVLRGGPGRDYVLGDEGVLQRDLTNNHVTVTLTGSFPGNDVIEGGPGDDFLWGQGGSDLMDGDDDDDELRGGADVDTMNGDADDDELYGDDGDDVMHGDAGNDYMRGGVGSDTMDGDDDTDEMYGDNDRDVMRGGPADDLMRGGSGDDDLEGNGNTSSALPLDDAASPLAAANFDLQLVPAAGNEYDVGGGGDGDVVYGDAGQDDIIGGSRGASPPADRGDTILGNAGQDVVVGDNGVITRPVGTDADGTTTRVVTLTDPGGAAVAQSDGDWIQGNEENDDVYAGGGGDLVHGDLGDDYVEGNGGGDGDADADTTPDPAIGLYGDTGQDDLIGGTSQGSGGVADGADDVWGGSGADVIAGDNATITRGAGTDCPAEPHPSAGYDCNTFRVPDAADVVIRRARIWDVATTAAGAPAGTSGGDSLGGQEGHDRLYGQGGDDRIEGGAADDFAFGNDGSDTIFGGDGQDDLIGGTGRTDSAAAASAADGRLDGADEIHGEADFDAIAGDNARMVRATTGADDDHGLWVANTFNDAVDRLIALMDVGVVGAAAGGGTSGNDELLGGGADDVVYGQGGNDGISGGDGQDIVEGNANGTGDAPDPAGTYGGAWPAFAGDVVHGDAGADDIAGGTGWIYRIVGGLETADPIAADVRVGADGRLDAGDRLFGDDGGDALAGDNTVIERALEGGEWILDDLRDPDALDVVRRIMRQRDVATTAQQAPLTDGTSGGDVISGDGGVDVAYGQGGDDEITGDAGDDHLEGNAGDDVVLGGEGQDDLVGGTGRTFSNDEATAAGGRIDESDTADANDVIAGGDGAGGVAADDDDVVIGDNGTVDRQLGQPIPTPDKLPFNGTWQATSWDEPAIRRVVRLLDVAVTGSAGPEADGTNGADTIDGEANDDLLFGQGGGDAIHGDDADLDAASVADASPGDDYVEGNGGADTIRGDLGQDDVTGGGSAANGVLDANRDGRLDDDRSGETLRDLGDTVDGDSGAAAVGAGDVVAGDNARIQRLLDGAGDWRTDAARGTVVRDVFLFDVQRVDGVGGFTADPGESAADVIAGNGGNDILLGQGNGAVADAYGTEDGQPGAANCQDVTTGPGTGPVTAGEEAPNGDNDDDDLPDLNDPQCRTAAPGDTLAGEDGQDYVEGNQGSDNLLGGQGEDDVLGGSSSNTGHLDAILPPAHRAPGFTPGAIAEGNKPFNLLDGHDVVNGNGEDDAVLGDNAFVDRYVGAGGSWVTVVGPGTPAFPATGNPNPEPARDGWAPTELVRRDVTTKQTREAAGAFGDDRVHGDDGKDDVYGLLGNDWLEGNAGEDAIVGDMGKVVANQLGGPTPDELADPSPLDRFVTPQQPFLGATIDYTGMVKREVTLYAFDQSQAATVGAGHDVALGGVGNDSIHTGPGQDLANGDAGDDYLWLGDNATAVTAFKNAQESRLAHDRVDAGWGGPGHDHLWGGYGADYLDVRPRSSTSASGIFPAGDPETWFQVAGEEPSENGVTYTGTSNFQGIDYIYGGWDQDTMQANEGDNGPVIGDRLLDWGGSYNGYYLCPATYGDWVSTRAIAPGVISFLQALSQGGGATTTATAGTSGFRETAIVFTNEQRDNTNPIHADTPAHFTCGPGTTTP